MRSFFAALCVCLTLAGCGGGLLEPEQTLDRRRGQVAASLIAYCVREGARLGDFRKVNFERFAFKRLESRGEAVVNYGLVGRTGETIVVSLQSKSCLIGSSAPDPAWISAQAALSLSRSAKVGRNKLADGAFGVVALLPNGKFAIKVSSAPKEKGTATPSAAKAKSAASTGIATYALARRVDG